MVRADSELSSRVRREGTALSMQSRGEREGEVDWLDVGEEKEAEKSCRVLRRTEMFSHFRVAILPN